MVLVPSGELEHLLTSWAAGNRFITGHGIDVLSRVPVGHPLPQSKAATNQLVKTLNLELQRASGAGGTSAKSGNASNEAIAIALHPGTLLGTDLSKPYVDPKRTDKDEELKEAKPGVHPPEKGAEMLMDVLKGLDRSQGGKFFDYAGKVGSVLVRSTLARM